MIQGVFGISRCGEVEHRMRGPQRVRFCGINGGYGTRKVQHCSRVGSRKKAPLRSCKNVLSRQQACPSLTTNMICWAHHHGSQKLLRFGATVTLTDLYLREICRSNGFGKYVILCLGMYYFTIPNPFKLGIPLRYGYWLWFDFRHLPSVDSE